MNLCINEHGLTFTAWHESAGYTLSWMARCDMRFFALLHKAWRAGADPAGWKGADHKLGCWVN